MYQKAPRLSNGDNDAVHHHYLKGTIFCGKQNDHGEECGCCLIICNATSRSKATINRDGSIWAKLGWWRGVPGTLVIQGHRLDGAAAPLHADIPRGYGTTRFQATGLVFPTVGC